MSTRKLGAYVVMGLGVLGLLVVQAAGQSAPVPVLTIDGTVYEDVGPLDMVRLVPGATVYLQVPMEIGPILDSGGSIALLYEFPYLTIDSVTSDGSGRYAFSGLAPGAYRLGFSHEAYQYKQVSLTLQADTTVNVWLLPKGAVGGVSGVVTEKCPDGWVCLWNPPVAGCTVEVQIAMYICMYAGLDKSAAPIVPAPQTLRAVTDSLGRYRIDSVPIYESYPCQGYSYSVKATKAGYADAYQPFVPELLMTVTANVEIERLLSAAAPLARTSPVSSAAVRVEGASVVVDLPRAQSVSVELLQPNGRRVDQGSYSRFLTAGTSRLDIGSGNAPGVYLVRVTVDGVAHVLTVRMGSGAGR